MNKSAYLISILFIAWISICTAQETFYEQLADSALTLTLDEVDYDPAYFSMDYPGGDVPEDKGVCTDVIVRAYRKMGIDLQKEVHEDMAANFDTYPDNWGLSGTDRNIDHRRVPNLMTFFERKGEALFNSGNAADYKAGDIVCWDLGDGITHIGIVSGKLAENTSRHLIIHNIGAGQVIEDCLFDYKITGHYRYE